MRRKYNSFFLQKRRRRRENLADILKKVQTEEETNINDGFHFTCQPNEKRKRSLLAVKRDLRDTVMAAAYPRTSRIKCKLHNLTH